MIISLSYTMLWFHIRALCCLVCVSFQYFNIYDVRERNLSDPRNNILSLLLSDISDRAIYFK